MRHYVTVADAAFLARLKVLHASMLRHCGEFILHVICWDDPVRLWARSAINVRVAQRNYIDLGIDVDKLPGQPRSEHEKMWAARSALTAEVCAGAKTLPYSLTSSPGVVQLDADLMFFSSPEALFEQAEKEASPMAVMPHYFSAASDGLPGITHESHAGPYGVYNSGSVMFMDPKVARRWADMNRDWCYFRVEDGKFADQKALEAVAIEAGASILPPWAFPGPWTTSRYKAVRWNFGFAKRIAFHGGPLVAWHFSSFRMNPDGTVAQYAHPEYALSEEVIRIVYEPYVSEMRKAMGLG